MGQEKKRLETYEEIARDRRQRSILIKTEDLQMTRVMGQKRKLPVRGDSSGNNRGPPNY